MPLTPVTWLDEFTVNLTTTGNQIAPVITQLLNGNIVVVWQSDDDSGAGEPGGTDIIGQIFDPLGNRIGVEFLANPGANTFVETAPAITALAGGGFAIAFERNEPGYRDIVLQTFDANGFAGTDRIVYLDASLNTQPDGFDPVIASSSITSILTVWRNDEAGGDSGIVGRIYDPITDTFGGQISLIDTASIDADPVVAVLNNGNYVIACHTDVAGDHQITLRIIDSTGANVLGAVAVPGTAGDFQREREPAITALEGGGFVVSWTREDVPPQNYIEFQIFTEAGVAVGGVVTVTDREDYEQSVVVALPDGGFIVAWDDDFTSTASLSAQRYDASGTAVGSTFQFAPGAALANLDAVALEDGRIALTFTRANGEIGMEILDVRDNPTTGGYTTALQIGTIGNDTFSGDSFAESVYGHDGNDVITVAGNAIQYFGGEGDDTINPGFGGGDQLYGGNGIDLVDWSGFIETFDFNLETGFATGEFGSAFTIAGFENLIGGTNHDTITGNAATNRLEGGDGNDTIAGGTGFADSLYGGLGDDSITSDGDGGDYEGNEGNDTLISGDGTESMYGGTNIDTIDHRGFDGDYEFDMESGQTNLISELYQDFEIAFMGDGNDRVTGTANGDTVYGGLGLDTLQGNQGADSLDGGLGEDHLWGGAGADTLNGGELDDETDFARYDDTNGGIVISLAAPIMNTGIAAGDEYIGIEGLVGSTGSDNITGDGGVNELYGDNGNDIISGEVGDDLLNGGAGDDNLHGGAGADILIGGSGLDVAAYLGSATGLRVDMSNAGFNTGEAAGDTYFSIEGLAGSSFSDTLSGNANANLVYGYDGNDAIEGRGGNDTLDGGLGNDTFISAGGDGADLYEGGNGNDVVDFSTASGFADVDLTGAALFNGGAALGDVFTGIEVFIGSAFNDTFVTGDGNDSLYGGDGRDVFAAGTGIDLIDGGGGSEDLITFELAAASVTLDLGNGASNTGEALGDIYLNVEQFLGSSFNDTMSGDGSANFLSGYSGSDLLRGQGGNDTLEGYDGNDTLIGGAGNDSLVGGFGLDFASYGAAVAGIRVDLVNSALNTGEAAGDSYSGVEGIHATNFNDTVSGDGAANLFTAYNGNDILSGLGGNDTLQGNDGNDTLQGGAGADRLEGGNGTDIASYGAATGGIRIEMQNTLLNTGEAAGDTYFSIDGIEATNFNDTVAGTAGNDVFTAYNGNDVLSGFAGNDTLRGNDGNDTLQGGLGADRLEGGNGTDVASYGAATGGIRIEMQNTLLNTGEAAGDTYFSIEGIEATNFNDTVAGTAGSDVFTAYNGNDVLSGFAGNDTLRGNNGDDTLQGGAGADRLEGGNNFDYASYGAATAGVRADLSNAATNTGEAAGDTYFAIEGLQGSNFNDILLGDAAGNVFFGYNGADLIEGRAGNDTLQGNNGVDSLNGGAGNDVLTGGADIDRFFFTDTASVDRVTDFQDNVDELIIDNIVWGNTVRTVADLLAPGNVTITANSVILNLAPGVSIELMGYTSTAFLTDDIIIV